MLTTFTDEAQRLLLDRIAEGVALVDATDERFPILEINGVYRQLLADPARPLAGLPWRDACPHAEEQGILDIFRRVRDGGRPFEARDFAYRRAPSPRHATLEGGLTYWDWKCLPLPGAGGTVERLLIIVTDVTERHQRERGQEWARREVEGLAAAAQRRAGQLEAVIGSMADGVFILDPQGVVLETNEAGIALLGLPRDAHAKRFNDYLLPLNPRRGDGRSLDPGSDLLAGVLAGAVVPDEQLLLDLPGRDAAAGDGERFVSFSAAPVREGDGRIGGAVVLLRDITAQRRLDQEKDAFLSLISHEVKSPLTAIKGFAQLARRAAAQLPGGERVGRHLDVIEQQIERVTRLVNDLAEASRLQQGTLRQEPVDFDLAPTVRSLVEQQQVTIATHRLELAIADEPLPVHADPARIEQVLTNLLTNAVKYSPDADRVAVALRRDGRSAHLTVRDWGIGIPRAEQGRLFGRFYRASNAPRGGGLGLGLFIAHEIIVRNGGRIWVESEAGQGSTFHVTLPLLDGRRA